MFYLQTREVGHWLFDEAWPGDQAHSLRTALLQPLQRQPRRWSQNVFRPMGLCCVLVYFKFCVWRQAVKLMICINPQFWHRIYTVTVCLVVMNGYCCSLLEVIDRCRPTTSVTRLLHELEMKRVVGSVFNLVIGHMKKCSSRQEYNFGRMFSKTRTK